MKILILSCNTGGGHNTAAKAIKEVFDMQNDVCIIKDALSFGGQLASDLVCDSYIEMVKKAPWMFGEVYKLGTKISNSQINKGTNLRSPVYLVNKLYADALDEYILKEKFDALICTHIFPMEAITHLKRRHDMTVPTFFVVTDYACPPMLEETLPDLIFAPHKDSIHTFTSRGITEEKLITSGIPVSQKFITPSDKSGARKELGLNEEDRIFLLMGGSMGFGDTVETAQKILNRSDKNTKLIAICGNNEKLKKEFEEKIGSDSRLVLVGFTDKVSSYMDASDILLSKPGGLSSTEAFVRGIPIIHTSPIPGCETENVEFFTQHHISLCAKDSAEAVRLAVMLMNDSFLKNQIVEAQKNYRSENSAKLIVETIKSKL